MGAISYHFPILLLPFRHMGANPLFLKGFSEKTMDAIGPTVPTLTSPLQGHAVHILGTIRSRTNRLLASI